LCALKSARRVEESIPDHEPK